MGSFMEGKEKIVGGEEMRCPLKSLCSPHLFFPDAVSNENNIFYSEEVIGSGSCELQAE